MSRSSESGARRVGDGDRLTDREIQILSLVSAGETTAAISRLLRISENTVKSHLTRVYLKTGSRNRVQAARYYLNHYTTTHGSDAASESRSSERAGQLSVIEHQVRQIQARLEQLAPAAAETERLRQALDALRDLETR